MTMVDPSTTGTQDDAPAIGSGSNDPSVSADPSTAGGSVDGETPEQLRARLAEMERIHKQDLARLNDGEDAKRRARDLELELERERAYRQAASQPPTGYDPNAAQLAQDYQSALQTAPEFVRLLEATASKTMQQNKELADRMERQALAQRFQRELDSVPAQYREEVERRSRSENLWPSLVLNAIKADKLDKTERELADQRRKVQEDQDRLNRSVVRTTATPAPSAASNNDSVTAEEWARIGRAAAAGDVEARRKVRAYDEGRLRIKD